MVSRGRTVAAMFSSRGLKATQTDWSTAASTRTGGSLARAFRARPWLTPVATTLAAWLAAFLVVTTLLTLFGDELGSLPVPLRALVISGVLVALMANLVMPVVSAAIARWLAGSPADAGLDAAGDCDGKRCHRAVAPQQARSVLSVSSSSPRRRCPPACADSGRSPVDQEASEHAGDRVALGLAECHAYANGVVLLSDQPSER
jgi:hypothetical protein